MRHLRRALALIAVSVVCIAGLPLHDPPAGRGMAAFVDDYFDALFTWSPTSATAWGNHDRDASIEDLSAAAHGRRIVTLKALGTRLDRLRAIPMSPDDEIDADILDGQIRAELLELETLETWRKNPMW
jgi:uncharacterized protein (DUF885 family)